MDKVSYTMQFFQVYEQSKSQHYSNVEIRDLKIELNVVATKPSCCFFICRLIDGTKIYETDWERSLDLSEYKEQRCLIF